jgi:hypothetical protein
MGTGAMTVKKYYGSLEALNLLQVLPCSHNLSQSASVSLRVTTFSRLIFIAWVVVVVTTGIYATAH